MEILVLHNDNCHDFKYVCKTQFTGLMTEPRARHCRSKTFIYVEVLFQLLRLIVSVVKLEVFLLYQVYFTVLKFSVNKIQL